MREGGLSVDYRPPIPTLVTPSPPPPPPSGDPSSTVSALCRTVSRSAQGSSPHALESGSDYKSRGASEENRVVLGPGVTTTTCDVQLIDDSEYELSEEFELVLSDASSNARVGRVASAKAVIDGPNDASTVTLGNATFAFSEDAGTRPLQGGSCVRVVLQWGRGPLMMINRASSPRRRNHRDPGAAARQRPLLPDLGVVRHPTLGPPLRQPRGRLHPQLQEGGVQTGQDRGGEDERLHRRPDEKIANLKVCHLIGSK